MKCQKWKEDNHNHLDDQGLVWLFYNTVWKGQCGLVRRICWQHALSGQGKALRLRFMSSKAGSVRIRETLVVEDLFG